MIEKTEVEVKVCKGTFQENSALIEEFRKLIAYSFKNPEVVLERHIHINNTAYLIYDEHELTAFMLVNWHDIVLPECSLIFGGLAITHPAYRSNGHFVAMLNQMRQEASLWAEQHRKPVWFYGFTSNPLSLRTFRSVFGKNLQPFEDLTFSPQAELVARKIMQSQFQLPLSQKHPFYVSKRFKQRYTDEEKQFQSAIEDKRLKNLQINEAEGDRLLFVAFL